MGIRCILAACLVFFAHAFTEDRRAVWGVNQEASPDTRIWSISGLDEMTRRRVDPVKPMIIPAPGIPRGPVIGAPGPRLG